MYTGVVEVLLYYIKRSSWLWLGWIASVQCTQSLLHIDQCLTPESHMVFGSIMVMENVIQFYWYVCSLHNQICDEGISNFTRVFKINSRSSWHSSKSTQKLTLFVFVLILSDTVDYSVFKYYESRLLTF